MPTSLSPKEFLARFKVPHKARNQLRTCMRYYRSDKYSPTPPDKKRDPIIEFSHKEFVLKTSTPVKPGADNETALKSYEQCANVSSTLNRKQINTGNRNQRESSLLRLPAEIRNIIYEYVLGGRTYRFKDALHFKHARLNTNGERHTLGLLSVCHQIYSEASLLPYSLNTFSFREFEMSLRPFLHHRHLAHFRAIKSIELVTYQAARMWAAPACFSPDFTEIREMGILRRLPNLKEIRVIVDLNTSLYVCYGTRDFDFGTIRQNSEALERVVRQIRPDVRIYFFWA
ncbi:hypothetical protein GQ44DRAFT_766072 [Phaeosphaeriaceae sp. PMI808]|nr:hypothetical protein GQ44DRAFT_766072 [Phaeosphaeriaceae sp. PMI808]